MLGPSKKHKDLYLGLNLHWCDLSERVSLAQLVLDLREKNGGELTYDDVKSLVKMYQKRKQPILRSYYYNRVSKRVFEIDEKMFLTAAAIPSEEIVNNMR
jgi:hypothetical protein